MRHTRIIFKRQMSGLCTRKHNYVAYWQGATGTPIAFINKNEFGYGVFKANGDGCGSHNDMMRAKMAIVEFIIDRQ